MLATRAMQGRIGRVGRGWRSLSPRRRLLVMLVTASIGGSATWQAYRCWTIWPTRLELRGVGKHYPVAFSPDGASLLTRSHDDRSLALWDPEGGRKLADWPDAGRRLPFQWAFSPDGRTFASPWFIQGSGKNFSVDLLDAATGRARATFESPLEGCLGVAFRDGGRVVRLVASSRAEHAVLDVDVATGLIVASRTPTCPAGPAVEEVSRDGRLLASVTATEPITLRLWDLDDDREAFSTPLAKRMIFPALAFSPDDKTLACGLEDGSIELWDVTTKSLRATLRAHSPNYIPRLLTFSPDGTTLSSFGLFDNKALSLDLARVYVANLLRDREHSMQSELIMVDMASGRRLVYSKDAGLVVFSPDGKSIASSHDDGIVRIHDAPKAR